MPRLGNPFSRRGGAKSGGRRRLEDEDEDGISLSTLESGVHYNRETAGYAYPSASSRAGGSRRGSRGSEARSNGRYESYHDDDVSSQADSELSAGPEKWRKVRRGAHLRYVPFDTREEDEAQDEEEQWRERRFPPLSEIEDDQKNWPKYCPFLHLKFSDFAISEKRQLISRAYYFWYFLVFTLTMQLCADTVTALMSPTPKQMTVVFSFTICFVGFWWFFFCHFRLLYFAMRWRKGYLYVLYALETFLIICLACYQCFSIIGSLSTILSPLAAGSPVPVRSNPIVPSILLCISLLCWIIVIGYCIHFIRRAFTYKDFPLEEEKMIWIKEQQPGYVEVQKKRFSDWIIDLFREKPDEPLQPLRSGFLQGKDLWLQGQLNFETVYLEFKADTVIFDHLVWERYHYQDILEVRKYGETGLLFRIVNPAKRELEDLELIFDLGDRDLRAKTYKAVRRLWRRVGRNVHILHKMRLDKLRKSRRPINMELDEPDLVVAFDKARKMESRERIASHLMTYRDWQKLLGGVKIHILHDGEPLLKAGDDFDRLYHIAQGRVEVSEVVDPLGATSALAPTSPDSQHEYKRGEEWGDGDDYGAGEGAVSREAASWQRYTAKRMGIQKQEGDDEEGSLKEGDGLAAAAEYEDPECEDTGGPAGLRDDEESASSSEGSVSSSEVSASDDPELSESSYSESSYDYGSHEGTDAQLDLDGPETVVLGTLQKDDIFGVVPFLLTKGDTYPKSGLTFVARDPSTVVFSLDTRFATKSVFKPTKDVTCSFFKYLAVILGERTEAAEDAMFTRKLREKRLEEARAVESQLARRRQEEEEKVFGGTSSPLESSHFAAVVGSSKGDGVAATRGEIVVKLFNLPATESVLSEFKGRYTYREKGTGRVLKVPGSFFITNHFFIFHGKKFLDANAMEINREMKDMFRHDDIITIRYEGKKGVLFTDQKLERKMFEVAKSEDRERFYMAVMQQWKNEGEVTPKEMRRLLRRKMTRLSLGYLNAAEQLTSQTIGALMMDMSEKDKKQLFAGSVPIGLNRNQVILGEQNYNENLYLLCTGIMRVQRIQEHARNDIESGIALDRIVFQEIRSGEIFGFDSFLTGAPAYSSVVVDSEKAVVRSCSKEQIMMRLKEDKKLAAKFYRLAAVSIAARLAELSPLDLFL